jgi:RING-box protein 1
MEIKSEWEESKVLRIVKCHAVGVLNMTYITDTCAICRNPIREACVMCQANDQGLEMLKCQKTLGKCGHCFHSHCIDEWNNKQIGCPLDMVDWVPVKYID